MLSYDELREKVISEISSPSLLQIPKTFFEDLRSTIRAIDDRIRETGSREPEKSLLLEEKKRLLDLAKLLVQERCRKIILDACASQNPPTGNEDETVLFKEVRRSVSSHMERFYRFLGGQTEEPKAGEISGERAVETAAGRPPASASLPERKALAILRDLPRFVGTDMKVYGPFKAEDVAVLPEDVSGLLISRKAAELIDPGSDQH